MSFQKPVIVKVSAVMTPKFKCDGCGIESFGSGNFRVEAVDPVVLHNVRGAINAYIPVGWASFMGGRHKCPECLK